MSDVAIHCLDLSKSFGPVLAVDGINLTLARGNFLALLGPSGCGKTTTLRLIAGFESCDAGLIQIGGRTVVGPGIWVPPERRRVGMVFQDYALFPHLDVAQNVAYGLPPGPGRSARVAEALSLVGLVGLGNRMPHELSGGQQQRVALARALAPEPEVILLDEPFSNLDATLRARVRAEVREILRAAGATAIFVTHDQEEALSLADQIAIMWQGKIIQVDEPEWLYRRPASREVAMLVGEANLLPGIAADGRVSSELGELVAVRSCEGPVEVMLRPEALELWPGVDGLGEVAASQFFGHDRLVSVRLPSGALVRARTSPEADFKPGQRVSIRVNGAVVVFPADASRAGGIG